MLPTEIHLPAQPPARDTRRRRDILAAAERAFVRHGFHASTMQDVAAEAGMSPGNLYRYFPSKDAIVAGLCECDQEELAGDFVSLEATGDVVGGIALMLRKRLIEGPRERLQLIIEIWAESARNSAWSSATFSSRLCRSSGDKRGLASMARHSAMVRRV